MSAAGVAVGDEIFGGAETGTFAEYALLRHFAVKPAGLSWAEAGGLAVAGHVRGKLVILLD